MNNYRLTIQYCGKNYAGWQIQNNADTVQQQISDSIQIIIQEKVNLIGSGRTDAGVHALGQVANFNTSTEIDIYKFQNSLNSLLPDDIAITKMEQVDEKFHSRFDAVKRSYLYIFSKIKSPFYKDYSYYYPPIENINFSELNRICGTLIGEHDFTSFSRKNTDTKNNICKIYSTGWQKRKNLFVFKIEANRFLHGMVRTIVGTTLFAVEKGFDENYIKDILEKKDREAAGRAVPAEGLFLFKVKY